MKQTQKNRIVAFCKQHGSITVRDAAVRLNINSPTKRISEMRASPMYVVDDVTEYSQDGIPFKRYFIKEAGA